MFLEHTVSGAGAGGTGDILLEIVPVTTTPGNIVVTVTMPTSKGGRESTELIVAPGR